MKLPFLILASAAVGLMLMNTSCTPTEEGMVIGGALGAGVGGAVTDSVDGAIVGGLIGAATGAIIGDNAYDDRYYRGSGYGPPPRYHGPPPRGYRGRRGYGY